MKQLFSPLTTAIITLKHNNEKLSLRAGKSFYFSKFSLHRRQNCEVEERKKAHDMDESFPQTNTAAYCKRSERENFKHSCISTRSPHHERREKWWMWRLQWRENGKLKERDREICNFPFLHENVSHDLYVKKKKRKKEKS